MKNLVFAFLSGFLLASPAAALADTNVGLVGSSTGAGVSVTVPVSPLADVRVQTGNGSINATITAGGNPYNGTLKLSNQSLIVDFHPARNAFIISGGAFNNGNTVSAVGQSQNGTITINGQTYTVNEAGTVSATASWGNAAPYVGLGFAPMNHHSGFALDAGAAFQGAPSVVLTSSGSLANDPAFQQNLNQAKDQIRQALQKFNVFPVITLRYSFNV